jgi:hypothetical protein
MGSRCRFGIRLGLPVEALRRSSSAMAAGNGTLSSLWVCSLVSVFSAVGPSMQAR